MRPYIISPEAQGSLKQIKKYSLEHFGHQQTVKYLQRIMHRLNELSHNPSLGMVRDDIKPGYYSSFIGSHTIYYRMKNDCIEVIDVLHQSMEPSRNL